MSASVTVIWLPVTFLPALSPLVDATASLICTHTRTRYQTISWLRLYRTTVLSPGNKEIPTTFPDRYPLFFFFSSLFPFFLPSLQARSTRETREMRRGKERCEKSWRSFFFEPQPVEWTRYPRPRMIVATVHSARLLCIPHIISNISVTISLSIRSRILRIIVLPDWNAISIEYADGIGTNCSNILSRR